MNKNQFTAFFRKGNRATWCIFALLALLTFIKCVIFQWEVYHSIMISSLWRDPLSFWSFWLPKIGISIFLASFVFFWKHNYWTVVLELLIDTWMLANMFYLRSNGILFDGFTFTMANNMNGFWNSVWALFQWKDIIPYLLTFIYLVILYFLNKTGRNFAWRPGLVILLIAVLINWLAFALVQQFSVRFYLHGMGKEEHTTFYYMKYNPFAYSYRLNLQPMNKDYGFHNFSVVHGFIYVMMDYIHNLQEMEHPYILTKEELSIAQQFRGTNTEFTYDNLLLIIIIESLESWTIDSSILPHLTHFMETHPVLYAKYLKSQIVGGSSADGQMIINTGVLPIQQGATCFRYPYITYPSLINRRDSAVTILTHSANCWNQAVMGEAYGYDATIEGTVEDSLLSERIINYAKRNYHTIQGITVASHVPFNYADCSSLKLPEEMPMQMNKYMRCLNWTDEGLGVLLERIDSIPQLTNATILITGDHTIFWKEKRDAFSAYCKKKNLPYQPENGFVPLIVYSPNKITKSLTIEDICYQMDIYPTILSLIGAEDYYWKGLGVNLLDSAARQNRPISEEEAYILSDKLIRSNWFANRK